MTAIRTETTPNLVLKAQTAAELMTRHVVSIPDDAPLAETIEMLVDRGFSGAPVVDAAGRAVGVVSLSDIVVHDRNCGGCARKSADATLVRDIMTPTVCSVRPHTPVRQVVEEMVLLRVRRLFVIDAEGVLVGVIATTDIVRMLAA
jgi:CBS domain-containing protein